MFRLLKNLFRPHRPPRPRELLGTPTDDQLSLRSTHPNSPPLSDRHATADAEGSSLLQSYWNLTLQLRRFLPRTLSWLEPCDLQEIGEQAVGGGGFADVRKGWLNGREVAVKSYRCYVRFDCDLIRMVSSNKHRYDPRYNDAEPSGSPGRHTHTASSPIGTSCPS